MENLCVLILSKIIIKRNRILYNRCSIVYNLIDKTKYIVLNKSKKDEYGVI
jgi:hypothetical protein